MEKNRHDDERLDDYVRKSFEDHEEDPSPGMWDRIEGDLPAPARFSFQKYRLHAVAAAVILLLLSGLVCEHFYYENKLIALESARKKHPEQPAFQSPVAENTATPRPLPAPSPTAPAAPDAALTEKTASEPAQPAPGPVARETPPSAAPAKPTGQRRAAPAGMVQNSIPPEPQRNGGSPRLAAAGVSGALPSQAAPVATPDLVGDLPPAGAAPSPEVTATDAPPRPVPPLGLLASALRMPEASASFRRAPAEPEAPAVVPPVEPLHALSGWYVGAQATASAVFEKTLPRKPSQHHGPGDPRPSFSSKSEKTDFAADWWLKIGKKFDTRFGLESGVGFRETARSATHSPKFKFKEGKHPGGPFGPKIRDFSYDLGTYGGNATVSLRVSQVDNDPVDDDEPLDLQITTSERVQLLRVPLLAVYRPGTARLQGVFKAGLTANFFLKNEVDISTRVSQNSRFQPGMGHDGYTLNPERRETFFLGYALSAGAEWKWKRNIGLMAEASLGGNFPRTGQNGQRLPDQYALGVTAGVNYWF